MNKKKNNTDYTAIKDYYEYTSRLFDSLEESITSRGNIILVVNSMIVGGSLLLLTNIDHISKYILPFFIFTVIFSILSIMYSIAIIRVYKPLKNMDMKELMHFRVVDTVNENDFSKSINELKKSDVINLFIKRIRSTAGYLVIRYDFLYKSFWFFIATIIFFMITMLILIGQGGLKMTNIDKSKANQVSYSVKEKKIKLQFVGVGSPLSKFYNTSILINENILLDAPPGIDKKLLELNQNLDKIDYVFISHFHGDHVLGIPQLLLNMRMLKRTKPFYIIGPKGIDNLINTILKLTSRGEEKDIIEKSNTVFIPISKEKEEMKIDKLSFASYKLFHGNEVNFGFLLNLKNRIIGYTGDTGPCKNLKLFFQKSNIIILDMTFEKTTKSHLGIDYIKELPMKYDKKIFFAIHRGKEIEDIKIKIHSVTLPKDGEIYEL